jgi:hypothetical protein
MIFFERSKLLTRRLTASKVRRCPPTRCVAPRQVIEPGAKVGRRERLGPCFGILTATLLEQLVVDPVADDLLFGIAGFAVRAAGVPSSFDRDSTIRT